MLVQLTRSQRFQLANLMYQTKVDGDPLAFMKTYNRTRLALGLSPIMDVLTGKPFDPKLLDDVYASFEITDEQRDFLLQRVLTQITLPIQMVLLGDLLDALETHKVTGKVPEGDNSPAYDKTSETWALEKDALSVRIEDLVRTARSLKTPEKDLLGQIQQTLEAIAA